MGRRSVSTGATAESRRRILRRAGRLLWIWGPPALYVGLIYALSAMSRPFEAIARCLPSDKMAHFVEYIILGLLLSRALHFASPASQAVGTIGFGAVYGLTDEWHQSFVPGRSCDIMDWVADVLGVTVGLLVWVWYARRQWRKALEGGHGPPQSAADPEPAERGTGIGRRY